MTNKTNHYFASCFLGWATADTQNEAVEKLANAFRSDIKKCVANSHKNGDLGFYIWSCRVLVPIDSHYRIEWFAPKDVAMDRAHHHHVTYITTKTVAFYTHKGDI